MWKIAAIKDSKVYIGQTSNFSWDKPNLSSQVHEEFDVWLISLVRLNKFGSSNTWRFIRLFQRIGRRKIVSGTNPVDLHMWRTNLSLINYKSVSMIIYV